MGAEEAALIRQLVQVMEQGLTAKKRVVLTIKGFDKPVAITQVHLEDRVLVLGTHGTVVHHIDPKALIGVSVSDMPRAVGRSF